MTKYIHDTIKNNLRFLQPQLTRPQYKAVHEMVRGLFVCAEPILRHLALNPFISAKKQADKYSHHLGNCDLTAAIDNYAFHQVHHTITKDTIISYDLTDINKAQSKKIAGLTRVWDGSAHTTAPGFLLHGIGVNHALLRLRMHNNNAKTTNQVRLELLAELVPVCAGKGIWVFDRGNDDKQFFKKVRQEYQLRFIARLKGNRTVVLVKTGVKYTVSALPCGSFPVYLLNNRGKIDTSLIYRVVVDGSRNYKTPIRLITNLSQTKKYSNQVLVSMYVQRWGIEESFKQSKMKFNLEAIRVLTHQRFANLVALVQFVMLMGAKLYGGIRKKITLFTAEIGLQYAAFNQHKHLTMNLYSFLSFLQTSLKPLIHKLRPPDSHLTLFSQAILNSLS